MSARGSALLAVADAATVLCCRDAPTAPSAVALVPDRDVYVAVPIDTLDGTGSA